MLRRTVVQPTLRALTPGWGALSELRNCINNHSSLHADDVRRAALTVEEWLADDQAAVDRVEVHRDIGIALYNRSPQLYSGQDLPEFLRRYTYPAFLSVTLNTHCNAACFFCREADYKGELVNFDDLSRLDAGVRNARVVEFTGWGEPFSYPRLEQVIDRWISLNSNAQFSFTTNGSLLSSEWGQRLRGRISHVAISVNAATEASYAEQMRYKNSKFTLELIAENISRFASVLTERDRSRLSIHMVANALNFGEIPEFVRLAARLGVPTVTIGNFMCASEAHLDKTLWHVKQDYNAALADGTALGKTLEIAVHGRRFFSNEKEVKARDTCLAPFERMYVEIPGSMTPCCYMGAARMGNVYDEGLEQVWLSGHMNALRKSRSLPACQVCTLFRPFDDQGSHVSSFLSLKDIEHETPTDVTLRTSRKKPKQMQEVKGSASH